MSNNREEAFAPKQVFCESEDQVSTYESKLDHQMKKKHVGLTFKVPQQQSNYLKVDDVIKLGGAKSMALDTTMGESKWSHADHIENQTSHWKSPEKSLFQSTPHLSEITHKRALSSPLHEEIETQRHLSSAKVRYSRFLTLEGQQLPLFNEADIFKGLPEVALTSTFESPSISELSLMQIGVFQSVHAAYKDFQWMKCLEKPLILQFVHNCNGLDRFRHPW